MQTIRVVLVDDHNVVRQGLKLFLATQPDIQVVGEADNGQAALALVEQQQPDVVLMDLVMPQLDGVATTQQIKRRYPEVEVIALTSFVEDQQVAAVIKAGAIGYLLKDVQPAELAMAIRAAQRGEVHLHPEAARRLMQAVAPREQPGLVEPLTEREIEVLRALARGESNRQIADRLIVSEKTVKAHVSNILGKLGLQSRTQAVLYALRHGIVSLDDIPL
ncbi:response regulator [Kallotenue papyrolyticum]|uniref:response regulator n=1 Tax=Kallotenue papyrolyticum TaxID=1325125 RepID=UPI000492AEB5|nr:response regulator transcription factor [Kallotenue papyrolyticum]